MVTSENNSLICSNPIFCQNVKTYRTRHRAGRIDKMPIFYAIITNSDYKDAISLLENNRAYLQALSDDCSIESINGTLLINGLTASFSEITERKTMDNIENLDLPLLRSLYSIILFHSEKALKEGKESPLVITIYVPDLLEYPGKSKSSRHEILSIIKKITQFHNLVGIINNDILPVMIYAGESQDKNTISFMSPYLTRVITETYKASIITDKKGKPITNKTGIPKTKPSHSYLIKPSIRNERNKAAIEIVHSVVTLIERSGNHTAHIRAKTLIEQNPYIMKSLDGENTSHQNQTLRRVFSKAWQLLKTHTSLEATYKNIKLPDAENPSSIPTMSTLDTVFEFKHDGKVTNVT